MVKERRIDDCRNTAITLIDHQYSHPLTKVQLTGKVEATVECVGCQWHLPSWDHVLEIRVGQRCASD
jgi:hypothetical protein